MSDELEAFTPSPERRWHDQLRRVSQALGVAAVGAAWVAAEAFGSGSETAGVAASAVALGTGGGSFYAAWRQICVGMELPEDQRQGFPKE